MRLFHKLCFKYIINAINANSLAEIKYNGMSAESLSDYFFQYKEYLYEVK